MEGMESRPLPAPTIKDRLVAAVTLKPEVYRQLGADQSATGQAVTVVVVAALVSGLSTIFTGEFGFIGWIVSAILTAVLFGVFVAILWGIGKLFAGVADYMSLFRGLGFAYAPTALGIIPVIGGLVGGIWAIVASIVAVREIHRVSQGAAVATVLIPVGVLLILFVLLAFVTGMVLLGRV